MFGATLNETWAQMPGDADVEQQLRAWGIWDVGLTKEEAKHRYARFQGVNFGVAPDNEWASMR